jgi:hypothetical protein
MFWGKSADVTVYIKCIARGSRLWHRDFDLEDYETGGAKFKKLHRDELEYHSRVRPHEKADLLLVREED